MRTFGRTAARGQTSGASAGTEERRAASSKDEGESPDEAPSRSGQEQRRSGCVDLNNQLRLRLALNTILGLQLAAWVEASTNEFPRAEDYTQIRTLFFPPTIARNIPLPSFRPHRPATEVRTATSFHPRILRYAPPGFPLLNAITTLWFPKLPSSLT